MVASELEGRVFVVTGASRGIGLQLVKRLLEEGARVVGVARSRQVLKELERKHQSFRGLACDLLDDACLKSVVESVRRACGCPFGLINNAGAGVYGEPAGTPYVSYEWMVKLNYLVPVRLTLEFVPCMVSRGEGVIVNVVTAAVYVLIKELAAYASSKMALHYFTEALRASLRGSGVRVIGVYPGRVRTEFFKEGGPREPVGYKRLEVTPHAVAQAVVEAVKRGVSGRVFVPWYLRLLELLPEFLRPRL